MVLKFSKPPCITIATIRGRARGGGNELALAFDLRYASREKAIFGQPEVGGGLLPGGGGTERLPRTNGRDRAKAMVNRAVLPPDADLIAAYSEFAHSLTLPAFLYRAAGFQALFAEAGIDVEYRLGEYIGIANQRR